MLSRTTTGLIVLGTAALALRVGLVLALSTEHRAPLTYEHGEIARNLVEGRGFCVRFLGVEGPTSQQAPLYPTLLAGLYWLFGVESPRAILAMQLLQCLAGAGVAVSVAWLGWSLLPERRVIGWLAGWGAALYPTHIYMATHIQVVTWAALCLTILMAVAVSPGLRGRWLQVVVAGVLAGTMLLIEPILVLALPFVGMALASTRAKPQANGARVAVMAIVASAIVAPWLWRNYRVHGEFVFIKSTFGYACWQGNNPRSWGTDKVPKPSAETLRRQHDGTLSGVDRALWEARHETLYIDDVLLKPGGYREFAGLSEPARSRLLGRRAWQFIVEQPERYLVLCGQRLRYFLLFDETNPKAANLLYRASTLMWLALAVAGLIIASFRRAGGVSPLFHPGRSEQGAHAPRSPRRMIVALWPTLAIFAAVTLFHTLTIVSARFRIPIEPLTFVWCAVAVASLARHRVAQAGSLCYASAVPMTPSVWPTATTSSSPTSVCTSTPATGAGRSTLTPPKSTSSTRSPSQTSSPTSTSHRLTVIGIWPAPSSGSVSSWR